jgi:hypothetical protein
MSFNSAICQLKSALKPRRKFEVVCHYNQDILLSLVKFK